MKRDIFWVFLFLLCHQSTAGKTVQNQVSAVKDECSSPSLNDRVSKLEAKDTYQEEEISFLKTTVLQLRGQVARLETAAEVSVVDDVITSQAKRPARLLPSYLFRYYIFKKTLLK